MYIFCCLHVDKKIGQGWFWDGTSHLSSLSAIAGEAVSSKSFGRSPLGLKVVWKFHVGMSYMDPMGHARKMVRYCWWSRNLAGKPHWDVKKHVNKCWWDKLPTSTGDRRISEPSTVSQDIARKNATYFGECTRWKRLHLPKTPECRFLFWNPTKMAYSATVRFFFLNLWFGSEMMYTPGN